MAEKNIKSRIVHKHDVESNWLKAENFIPLKGELIIYDIDENYTYERFKIGDGATLVNNLPFALENNVSIGSDNTILADNSFSAGFNNIAGGKAFKIVAEPTGIVGETGTYTLDSVTGIEVGMTYSAVTSRAAYHRGTIQSVNSANNTVTVNNYAGYALNTNTDDPDNYNFYNTFLLDDHPELGTISIGANAAAFGQGVNAHNVATHAEGKDTKALGKFSHTEGQSTIAGHAAHAEGLSSQALGGASHAEGQSTQATATAAHSEGYTTFATAKGAHAEGISARAYGEASHAEGTSTLANTKNSHAEGYDSSASGEASHAEGYVTIANGKGAHAEGYYTEANGNGSHAEGSHTKTLHYKGGSGENVSSDGVHAEGHYTIAQYKGAHAEGYGELNKEIIASGFGAHAEGIYTQSVADGAHAEGRGTTSTEKNQHVQGKYNYLDANGKSGNYAHIVGNGTSDTERSNAHTLDWNGNAWFAGDVTGKNGKLLSEAEVVSMIANAPHLKRTIITELPEAGDANTIYMIPTTAASDNNIYLEYMYLNNSWEQIGSSEVDLTNYVKNTDYASADKGGAVKIRAGYGLNISNGVLSVRGATESNIDAENEYMPITPKHLKYAVAKGGEGHFATEDTVFETSSFGWTDFPYDVEAAEWDDIYSLSDNQITGGGAQFTIHCKGKTLGFDYILDNISASHIEINGVQYTNGSGSIPLTYMESDIIVYCSLATYEFTNMIQQSIKGVSELETDIKKTDEVLQKHTKSEDNPHGVTASQVGAYTKEEVDEMLENVDVDVDLSEYVKNTDYATGDKAGVIKVYAGNGVSVFNGQLALVPATNAQIDGGKAESVPITPKNLKYAVKSVGDGYYAKENAVFETDSFGWTDFSYDVEAVEWDDAYELNDNRINGGGAKFTIHCKGKTLGFDYTCDNTYASYLEVNGVQYTDGSRNIPLTYMETDVIVYCSLAMFEFSNMTQQSIKGVSELESQIGDIDTALDAILDLQNSLIGGDAV